MDAAQSENLPSLSFLLLLAGHVFRALDYAS